MDISLILKTYEDSKLLNIIKLPVFTLLIQLIPTHYDSVFDSFEDVQSFCYIIVDNLLGNTDRCN